MSERWAINGHWVVKRFALFGGKLVVLDRSKKQVASVALQHEWPLSIGGRAYRIVRRQTRDAIGRPTEQLQIFSAADVLIPPGGELLQPTPCPPGSKCNAHPAAQAARCCARCGAFVCEQCLGADGVRCQTCFGAHLQQFSHQQSALLWAAPAPFFYFIAGGLGLVLGGIAAAVTVAYARRGPKARSPELVAISAYLVAFGLCLAARWAVSQWLGSR